MRSMNPELPTGAENEDQAMRGRLDQKRVKPRRVKTCLLAVALCLLALPASASGFTITGGPSVEFHLNGSNGYKVGVESEGPRRVSLTAVRAGRALAASADYTVRGKARSTGIDAKFGDLGRMY